MKVCPLGVPAVLGICFLLSSFSAEAQQQPEGADQSQLSPHAGQVAEILGIKPLVDRAMLLNAGRPAGTSMSLEELALRQEISESILAAGFDVDGVLAEIEEERARIFEARAYLQARRDRGVNLASLANLITGTGVGIAVNALQFSSSTANVGNGIGVGSGVGSTVLSLIGIRLQRGPAQPLGSAPNMLAVPFGRKPVLSSNYPDDVLAYLNSVPPGEAPDRGTRLQQLMRDWVRLGRLDPPDTPKGQKEIDLMTASLDPKQKLRIDDLTNRAMMLADVEGRVSLMKRDLAELMRVVRAPHNGHATETGDADPFAQLREEWATALHAKQLDQLVMLYVPDAVFLTPDGGRFTGRPAIRELSQKAMDTFTSDIKLHSIAREQSGNLGYDGGDYSETLVANSDGSRTEAKGNYLMVLKRQSDGRWLILEQVWTESSPGPRH